MATQGRSCRTKGGLWKVLLDNGDAVLTHGADSRGQLIASTTTSSATTTTGGLADVYCAPAGTSRTQLIYARASDVANASATLIPLAKQAIYDASAIVDREHKTVDGAGSSKLRVACAADGTVQALKVVLPTTQSSTSFGSVVADLQTLGYGSGIENYAVYFDGFLPGCSDCAGTGSMYLDDRPGAENYANFGGLVAVSWGWMDPTIFLHEIAHNQGAVQNSAPHSSGAAHCIDGSDIMCYPDGGPYSDSYSSAVYAGYPFDCGHDDYFNPTPASGSYLDTHWNLASVNNKFMEHVNGNGGGATTPPPAPADTTAPSTPVSLTSTGVTATSVSLRWNSSTDNVAVASYNVWKKTSTGSWSLVGTNSATATSGTVNDLPTGVAVTFAVNAIDAAGNASARSNEVTATPLDTVAPSVPGGLKVTGFTTSSVSLAWNAATDNIGVKNYRVWRKKGSSSWSVVATISAPTWTNSGFATRTGYSYAVSAGDSAGNWSARSASVFVKTA